jgi:adenosylcobinamide kinase/adenosylcobinamide-phosphate guanylyltransferase
MTGSKCFIATCPVVDSEMDERIVKHKQDRRGKGWETVEEQFNIADIIKRTQYSVVLIDCLTLWVNNILYHYETRGEICGEKEIIS